ncbi:hypothetical protein T07_9855 [Trichinella nelsoni]|uniref:Uncharacterized protein n=1 Tax=Trichinella nelsoni TaxID=6336 RepID=A0A0V0RKY1_9BILA|nr:hypothetical protein T07_9855 [Trichinella nelsoni]
MKSEAKCISAETQYLYGFSGFGIRNISESLVDEWSDDNNLLHYFLKLQPPLFGYRRVGREDVE